MKIRWSPQSHADMKALVAYLNGHDPDLIVMILPRIMNAVERLASLPAMGCVGRLHGTRELVLDDLPYLIPYRVRDETLEILRVYHTSRRWPPPKKQR